MITGTMAWIRKRRAIGLCGLSVGMQVLLLAMAMPAAAEQKRLRIATWNFSDLWHEPGQPLRRGARKRGRTDIERLRDHRTKLDADIIALQGIGSPKAARLIFPARNYYLIFSKELAVRYSEDRAILTVPSHRRTYVAVAIRRSSNVRIRATEHILELADPSPNLGPNRPQGHSGLAIRIKIANRQIWILAVDLTPGCRTDTAPAFCQVLDDQVDLVQHWVGQKERGRQPVIILGTVPRLPGKRPDGTPSDQIWRRLSGLAPSKTPFVRNRELWRRNFSLANRKYTTRDLQKRQKIELRGPSRNAGEPFIKMPKRPRSSQSDNGLIYEAISAFTQNLSRPRKPRSTNDPKGKPAPSPPRRTNNGISPSKRTAAQIYGPAPPHNIALPRRTARPTAVTGKHVTRYPDGIAADTCPTVPVRSHNGEKFRRAEDYILIDNTLMKSQVRPSFGTAIYTDVPANWRPGLPDPNPWIARLPSHCPLYVDLPLE